MMIGHFLPAFLHCMKILCFYIKKKTYILSPWLKQHGEIGVWPGRRNRLTQHMHTGLKSEFLQQSLISKCLLNSVILWNEIMLFGVKANWISHDGLPDRKLCQGSDGAKRSVNNLPSPLKLELYWGVVIVYLLCTEVRLPFCTPLALKGIAERGMLQNVASLEVWFCWKVRKRSYWRIVKKKQKTLSSWSWKPRPGLTEPAGLDTHTEMMSRCRSGSAGSQWSGSYWKTITTVPPLLRVADLHDNAHRPRV